MTKLPYIWRIPDAYPSALIGEYCRQNNPDRFLFNQGRSVPIDVGVPVIRFSAQLKSLLRYSCLPNNAMLPLIDSKTAIALQNIAPADIQLIKARVEAVDGGCEDFFILNVVSKVVGIDREQSILSLLPGTQQILGFRRLVYIEGCLDSHKLARDAEYLPHILVSAEVVGVLKETTGVEFRLSNDIEW